MIFGSKRPSFLQRFGASSSLCPSKYSASAVELGFLGDFLVRRDLVFVNGLCASSSLCALKISASAVELGFLGDVLVRRESVFVNSF